MSTDFYMKMNIFLMTAIAVAIVLICIKYLRTPTPAIAALPATEEDVEKPVRVLGTIWKALNTFL